MAQVVYSFTPKYINVTLVHFLIFKLQNKCCEKDLIAFLCNNFVVVRLRLKVVWVWPPPTGRTCWPSSHTSPTGAPYISASALCSTNTETRGHRLLSLLNTFPISPVCVTLFHLISRLDPTSALDFLWACSHIPSILQGRDQKTPQVWSQLI